MVRSIHRSLSEPVMGTSAPTILRAAGAAMAASPSSASASPAAAAGRRVLERVGFGRRDGVRSEHGAGAQGFENKQSRCRVGPSSEVFFRIWALVSHSQICVAFN
jgi:hypothetical protein